MNYRKDRYGGDISVLGFGCMRFPRRNGRTDIAETEREIMHAIENGVNYFDTAYVYPGSEAALGGILAKNNARSRVKIATKLPHYLIKNRAGLEKMFAEQLRRLQTDHVDYYLMHMLTDVDTWDKLLKMGVGEWIVEMKEAGRIGQIGFSYHGNSDMFCRLVDAYDWDFVQIQYNYVDEHSQAGRRGLEHAAAKGLPVIIMEPLRGGKLVNRLPDEVRNIFKAHDPGRSPARWAFDWLWDQSGVTCVLSGMNSMAMLNENIDAACEAHAGCFSESDRQMLRRVVDAFNANMKVGCTGCGYCMPCPQNVDIPGAFAAYNRRAAEGRFWSFIDYTICTALRKNPTPASNCVGCGKCEKHCPQHIMIREKLAEVEKEFEGPVYKTVKAIIRKLNAF